MTKKTLPIMLALEGAQKLIKQPSKRYPTGLRNKAIYITLANIDI